MNDALSECVLQMYEVSLKYLWRLSSYRADPRTQARGGGGGGGELYMQELWFLYMTPCLNVLYNFMKFRWNTSNCYQVIERTQIALQMIKGN